MAETVTRALERGTNPNELMSLGEWGLLRMTIFIHVYNTLVFVLAWCHISFSLRYHWFEFPTLIISFWHFCTAHHTKLQYPW